ncbi:hypothetical protein EJ07DRAFT_150436 [Lizonia empirigonia]|nr:hypothetical protein EJ07DRAFT_150436 [Lizonia empirigonia]
MRSAIISVVVAVVSAQTLSSTPEQAITLSPTPTLAPAPACTRVLLKLPSFGRTCTDYGTTLTYTSYIECGGCTLVTKRLGLGLPCQKITSNPGNTEVTVTSCRPAEPTVTETLTYYASTTGEQSLSFQ